MRKWQTKVSMFAIVLMSSGLLNTRAGAMNLLSATPSSGDNPVPQAAPTPFLLYQPMVTTEPVAPYTRQIAAAPPPSVSSASLQETLLAETGSSVTVITAADLARRQVRTVAQALQTVPGLDVVSSGGPGQITSIFLRGAASNHTLLLLDGAILNDPVYPGRGADLSKLTLDNVERIEIVRGPQSAVFGSGAMGGVVNIITRKNVTRGFMQVGLEAGKYQTYLGSLNAAGTLGAWDASFGGSYVSTEGFSAAKREQVYPASLPAMLPNSYHNLTTDLGLGYRALPNLAFRLGSRIASGDNQLDSGGGDFGDAKDYGVQFLQAVTHLTADWDLWDNRWRQKLTLGDSEWKRETRNDPGAPFPVIHSNYQSRQASADWRNQIGSVTAGVTYRQEQAKSYDETNLLYGFPPSEFPERSSHQVGLYLEDQFRWERLAVSAGMRWDYHDQYGSETTYRVAPVYAVPGVGTRLKASYGTAFNAPSLDQLYSSYGDPALKPEVSRGWDAGFEQPVGAGAALLGASYFHADYSNQIVSDPVTWQYRNLGQVQTAGLEAFAQISPVSELDLRATYTRLMVTDLNDFDTQAPLPLVRRADYKTTLSADYRWSAVRVHAALRRIGPRLDLDPATYSLITLAPYTVVDFSAAYEWDRRAEIYFRLENALDADYTDVAGYSSPRFGAYAGVKLTLL